MMGKFVTSKKAVFFSDFHYGFRSSRSIVLDGKSSQEYFGNADFPQGCILGLFSYYMTEDFPDDFISNVSIYGNDTTL